MPSVTLTIAANNTNYNLFDLITAVNGYSQAKRSCRDLTIRCDPTAGGAKIKLGDGLLSDTNFAVELILATNPEKRWDTGAPVNDISLTDKFIRSDTGSVKVDVDFHYA